MPTGYYHVDDIKNSLQVLLDSGAHMVLQMLLRLEDQAGDYYPYHAGRADLFRRMNQHSSAADSYKLALASCGNSVEHSYLQRRLDEMLNLEGN